MNVAGGIRQHLKAVEFGLGWVGLNLELPQFGPNLLPFTLDTFKVVLVSHISDRDAKILIIKEQLTIKGEYMVVL